MGRPMWRRDRKVDKAPLESEGLKAFRVKTDLGDLLAQLVLADQSPQSVPSVLRVLPVLRAQYLPSALVDPSDPAAPLRRW